MRQLFTGFAAALVVLCTYGEAQAQLFKSNGQSKSEIERAKYLTPKPFEPNIAPFTEDDFINKPWLREFRYVFVINKANVGRTAQTIRVYDSGYLIYKDKVSTGREGFEMARASYFHKGPTKSYWSVTPVGYYQPKWLSKDH